MDAENYARVVGFMAALRRVNRQPKKRVMLRDGEPVVSIHPTYFPERPLLDADKRIVWSN